MSQQADNLHTLDPIVVTQKVVGVEENTVFVAWRRLTASKAYAGFSLRVWNRGSQWLVDLELRGP